MSDKKPASEASESSGLDERAAPGGLDGRATSRPAHTPGPWRTGTQVHRTIYGEASDRKGHLIGVMDRREDAALCATAPEMLEVLSDLLNCAAFGAVPKRVWDRALAVRAKAKGQVLAPPSGETAPERSSAPEAPGAESPAKSEGSDA